MSDPFRAVRSEDDLQRALGEPVAVLYKHSPVCGMSASASVEVQQFAASHPDVPVYMVDVVGARPVSRVAAQRLEVQHESPQVILLVNGKPLWHASHFRVSCDRLERALEQNRSGADA